MTFAEALGMAFISAGLLLGLSSGSLEVHWWPSRTNCTQSGNRVSGLITRTIARGERVEQYGRRDRSRLSVYNGLDSGSSLLPELRKKAQRQTAMTTTSTELEPVALTLKERADCLLISDQSSYGVAAELLLAIKDLRKAASDHHRPMIDAAHKAWKATLGGLQKIDGPLEQAEHVIKTRIAGYLAEQERKRVAEEKRLREETVRLALDSLERDIEEAEAQGASAAEVKAIIDQPAPMPAVYVAPTVQAVPGVSTAQTYRAEVFDIKMLCDAVARQIVSEAYVIGNMPALNGVARSTRGALKIPGVRIVWDTTVRAGRK